MTRAESNVSHDLVIVVFFQAEDGIRDIGVTGVQTCALPICDSAGPRDVLVVLPAARGGGVGGGGEDVDVLDAVVGHLDRKSVGLGKSGDLGGRRIIKKR